MGGLYGVSGVVARTHAQDTRPGGGWVTGHRTQDKVNDDKVGHKVPDK